MPPPIAYLAGQFPSPTETFVYREVIALRDRGWAVHSFGLHPSNASDDPILRKLAERSGVVYGRRTELLGDAFVSALAHPLKSLATLSLAFRDAVTPGEPTRLKDRLKLPGQAIAGIGLSRQLRKRGVRHLHCHFAHAPTSVGMYAARHAAIPFSFTGHANDLFQRRAILRRKIERAAFVACISRWHAEYYRAAAPASGARFVLIRCGVDLDGWRPPATRSDDRDGRPLRVLTVCRLIEKKGVDTLLRALPGASNNGRPRPQLTIAGDGPELSRLRSLAKELGCERDVVWTGRINNAEVRELLGEADVFALPCRTDSSGDRDGIPVALMEAMACGVPVISGDLPAIRELIEHEVSGLLIDGEDSPNRVATLADHLRRLADDPAERTRLADAGRRRVLEEFSLAANVTVLENSIQSALDHRAS